MKTPAQLKQWLVDRKHIKAYQTSREEGRKEFKRIVDSLIDVKGFGVIALSNVIKYFEEYKGDPKDMERYDLATRVFELESKKKEEHTTTEETKSWYRFW